MGTGALQGFPTTAEVDVAESGIGAGMTSFYGIVTYSAKAIKSLVPKLKKDDLESYIVWNRKFTANLMFNNLLHVINANYMAQALPPTQAEVMNLPRNHYYQYWYGRMTGSWRFTTRQYWTTMQLLY